MKTALLSNINTDYILRILSKDMECVPSVGYGDIWGQLLNPGSILNTAEPDNIIFIIDVEDLISTCATLPEAMRVLKEWFNLLDTVIQLGKNYYVSDITFRNSLLIDNDSFIEHEIIYYWTELLRQREKAHSNIHALKLNKAIEKAGKEKVFSSKMWYMGKLPYTMSGAEIIAETIISTLAVGNRTAKKVLILDLDNTLWGGVLGETGASGIELSDDHIGAVYKKVQQRIKQIKETGILLAINSKNNESDVQEVWDNNPHMLLKRDDFISVKINWKDKAENILEIAKELNLGVDSFVFVDDMAPERENIRLRLPDVTVPDFPEKKEAYPDFIEDIYERYFLKLRLSAEDKVKTEQYIDNKKREEASKGLSYDEFLLSLNLKAERVALNDASLDRIAQLHGKTNQFNLTTIRYSRQDIDKLLSDGYEIYAYNVKDKFGEYGLVAVAIVDIKKPEIRTFLMSCRIMGKMIENYVIDQIEEDLIKKGADILYAKYIPTAKNVPVMNLFDDLGYSTRQNEDGTKEYEIDLRHRPERKYYVSSD